MLTYGAGAVRRDRRGLCGCSLGEVGAGRPAATLADREDGA